METIKIETKINAPLQQVWNLWTTPEHIMKWNNASPDWHTPSSTNDLRTGGTFTARMEAKDGSRGFDFKGTYTDVVDHKKISYVMEDGRKVDVFFHSDNETTSVTEVFEPETENSIELQRNGWQAILDNFRDYVERSASRHSM